MKKLRQHQLDLLTRAKNIISGFSLNKLTLAHSIPGAGKSIGAVLFTKELIENKKIDHAIWVCPRTSLTNQSAEAFKDKELNPYYTARVAENKAPLFRDTQFGCIAYTTTYQAIAANPKLHFDELKDKRYLLILDEPHHLKDKSGALWTEAIQPIFDKATHTLMMTGTIERHDKKLIPFIPYEEEDNLYFPKKDIYYSRFDALLEEAIIPIEFAYEKGWAEFEDEFGIRNVEISQASEEDVSKVIRTFLSKTGFRNKLLDRGVTAWLNSLSTYKSRMIVVCSSQKMAKGVTQYLKSKYSIDTVLAISDDPESHKNITEFRKKIRGQVLVTVGMAYEGLDVPDCKYLICLTNTRSLPWLEQAFARVTRVDYSAIKEQNIPYQDQKAFIFVPDDPKMQNIVKLIIEEQDKGVKGKKAKKPKVGLPMGPRIANFKPIGAESSGSETEIVSVNNLVEETFYKDSSLYQTDEERDKRKQIDIIIRRRDSMKRLERGTTFALVKGKFSKTPDEMTTEELSEVLSFLDLILHLRK